MPVRVRSPLTLALLLALAGPVLGTGTPACAVVLRGRGHCRPTFDVALDVSL